MFGNHYYRKRTQIKGAETKTMQLLTENPLCSCLLISAPCSSSTFMAPTCPFLLAYIRGVIMYLDKTIEKVNFWLSNELESTKWIYWSLAKNSQVPNFWKPFVLARYVQGRSINKGGFICLHNPTHSTKISLDNKLWKLNKHSKKAKDTLIRLLC